MIFHCSTKQPVLIHLCLLFTYFYCFSIYECFHQINEIFVSSMKLTNLNHPNTLSRLLIEIKQFKAQYWPLRDTTSNVQLPRAMITLSVQDQSPGPTEFRLIE